MNEAEKKAKALKDKREKLMKLKEKGGFVSYVKSLFDKFAMAELKDGTQIMYEGDLAVGTVCTVEVDGAEVPLAEGKHELGGDMAGKSIVVDATGTVQEIVDEAAASEEGDGGNESTEQNSEEGMKMLAKLTTEKLEKMESNYKAKFEAQEKENKRLQSLVEKLAADFVAGTLDEKQLKETLANHKTDYTSKLA